MTLYHILLAEDNPADIYLIRQALQEHNVPCEMHVVEDGQSAIQFVTAMEKRALDPRRPDLILLDLNLPQHDGIEILRLIRSNPDLARIPVAILTSSDSPRDRDAVDQLGITRYIRKPSDLQTFLNIGNTIKEILKGIPARSTGASSIS